MGFGIDIGVGGRFHADRLAALLLAQSQDVHLWTTYPKSRFPALPATRIHSFLWPEVLFRLSRKIGLENRGDLTKMKTFGRELARALSRSPGRDCFIGWSSFSLETLKLTKYRHRALIRDSVHYRVQMQILDEESRKNGLTPANRSEALDREEEEYERADTIFVLSAFAKKTFIDSGVPEKKLRVLTLGADTRLFQPVARPTAGRPLNVVYFGGISLRKGIPHLLKAAEAFAPDQLKLTVIGNPDPDLKDLPRKHPAVQWIGALPQPELAARLPHFDVFVLPTLEDGFGMTLLQAMACGVVPISTDRCGAAECLQEGVNGFLVPAGDSASLQRKLEDLVRAPQKVAAIRAHLIQDRKNLGWSTYEQEWTNWLKEL